MRRLACLLSILVWLHAVAARAQDTEAFTGHWVWEAEGQPLLLISLSANDAGQLTGTMQRPRAMQLTASRAGIAVSDIRGPLHSTMLRGLRHAESGHVLGYSGPDGSARESVVRPDGRGGLTLVFFAAEPGGMAASLRRLLEPVAVNQHWDPDRTYFVREPPAAPNAELAALHAADQADRNGTQDMARLESRDTARRARVRQLLDQGLLRAADDYYRAAVIYQHGTKPEDFLLAHVLSMAAMALGRGDAGWLASATLDRYLWSQDAPQVLGTQYAGERGRLTQAPYAATLVPDSLRLLLGVPERAEQAAQGEQINRGLQGR